MVKHVVRFFDKLEDHIRGRLSHYPIIYAIIGAVGIILFWKGVWESAAYFPVLNGPTSILLGIVILLMTGLLVSFFIGDSILISGYTHEKKVAEKTESEIELEANVVEKIEERLDHIEADIKREHAALTEHTHR